MVPNNVQNYTKSNGRCKKKKKIAVMIVESNKNKTRFFQHEGIV